MTLTLMHPLVHWELGLTDTLKVTERPKRGARGNPRPYRDPMGIEGEQNFALLADGLASSVLSVEDSGRTSRAALRLNPQVTTPGCRR